MNKNDFVVNISDSIKEVLTRLNEMKSFLTLFVVDNDNVVKGTVTDGDIRRGLINGSMLDHSIDTVMFKNFRYLSANNIDPSLIKKYKEQKIVIVPLVDNDMKLIDVVDLTLQKTFLPIDAVLMAGGKGVRLRPLTDNTPKPLLQVGDKAIIDYNIDALNNYGFKSITITLKYLADKIRNHFDGYSQKTPVSFFEEDIPLGTIGALSIIENLQSDYVLLMNSDLLTNINYEDFYLELIKQNADVAIASIPYKVSVPYAVLESEGSVINSLIEKPTYTYFSSAGIYLIKRKLLDLLPKGKTFDAPDFINILIEKGLKIVHYPILGYWLDIGKKDDFLKAQEDVKHIVF